MKFKTFKDDANSYKFNYTFIDTETAQVAGHAVLGFMLGTFYTPAVELNYAGNTLEVKYLADGSLNKNFKKICDSFKDYYKGYQDEDGESDE